MVLVVNSLDKQAPQTAVTINVSQGRNQVLLFTPLRILKGKRVVFEGQWNGLKVLAKLFSTKRHYNRELKGLKTLEESKIECPSVLFEGCAENATGLDTYGFSNKPPYVLLLEFFPEAQDFRTLWRSALNEERRSYLFSQLLNLIAQHHNNGIIQNDLHLGNFLVVNGRLISIDGDAIDQKKSSTDDDYCKQVGILLAQSFPRYDLFLENLLPVYFDARNIDTSSNRLSIIREYRALYRKKACNNWIGKSFRNSTQFKAIKHFDKKIYMSKAYASLELENTLKKLADTMTPQDQEWTIDSCTFRSKFYPDKTVTDRKLLRENEASVCWKEAQRKVFFGDSSSKPAALILKTSGPVHVSGLFVEVVSLP